MFSVSSELSRQGRPVDSNSYDDVIITANTSDGFTRR